MSNWGVSNIEFFRPFNTEEDIKVWLNEQEGLRGFCMCGRSNVGKSSLINKLFNYRIARTAKMPGRTREIIAFKFAFKDFPQFPCYFFDLPGYGFARVSKEMKLHWNKLMGSFFENIPKEIVIVNVQDSRHPDQKADKVFNNFMKQVDNEVILAFNKLDKLKTQKERHQLEKLQVELYETYKTVHQIHFLSAKSGKGIDPFSLGLQNLILPQ